MAALNPYSQNNSTYMPVGESKRNDEVVSKYKPEGFDSEAEGVIFAMLMQYAKTDSENAEKRARQFAKILYEYSSKLINDLDVSNSVIAKKIVNAIDNKVAAELNPFIEDVDFNDDIDAIKKTVSGYLTSLVEVASGNLITASQVGLSPQSSYSGSIANAAQTDQEKIDAELSESFIELIRRENALTPDARKMSIRPLGLTTPAQALASSAFMRFGASVMTFTGNLTSKTVERLNNIQKAVVSFGQAGALASSGGEEKKSSSGLNEINDSHNTIKQAIKVKRGSIAAHMALVHAELLTSEEEQKREESHLREWVATVDAAKKQFDQMKHVVGSMIAGTIQFASTAFKSLANTIKSVHKKVKKGGFLHFLFSPSGILTFGLLGWAGYKLIFSEVGKKIKNSLVGIVNSAIAAVFPDLDKLLGIGQEETNNEKLTPEQQAAKEKADDKNLKTSITNFLNLTEAANIIGEGGFWALFKKPDVEEIIKKDEYGIGELFPKEDESQQKNEDEKDSPFKFIYDEIAFYQTLSIGKNGAVATGEQLTDHWLENIEKMDALVGRTTTKLWGVTPQEWLLSLGKDHTTEIDTSQKTGNGWIDNIKKGMSNFWEYIKNAVSGTAEWFKNTSFGKSVVSMWDTISETCKSIYNAYKPIVKIALKLSPLLLAIGTILTPPIGVILNMVGKFGKLVISLTNLSFMRPVMGAIGGLIKSNPLMGLMIAGVAIGLGALSMGIWNAFHKKPMDNGGIMPLEQYAISMGLERGQIDKFSLESRLESWKQTISTYDPENAESQARMDRIRGIDSNVIKFIENGVAQFEENYRFTMDNQDAKNVSSLHWYILNRDENSRISNSIWARRLAELPILGIGPDLIHKSMYSDFISQLDTKFPRRNEDTWQSVRSMLMRMKEVDRVFRFLVDSATPQEIGAFVKGLGTEKGGKVVKAIYDWTHGDGRIDLQENMSRLFGMVGSKNKMQSYPNISIVFDPKELSRSHMYMAKINVNGKESKLQMPGVKTKDVDDLYVFDTLFSGIARNKARHGTETYTERGVQQSMETKQIIVGGISPLNAARAFVNYMNRSRSGFYTLSPWNFSKTDVDKLQLGEVEGGERLYKMKDLIKETDQYKSKLMDKIQETSANDAVEQRYSKLPNFDGQNDSKMLVGMVYVLGKILEMCDEID